MAVSSQIIEVLNDLCLKFGIAVDWTQDNVLPYVQELAGKYISWEIATSWMWIALCAAGLLFAVVLWGVEMKFDLTGVGILYPASVLLFILCGHSLFTQIHDIITCTYFPEMKILQYIVQYL